MKNSTNSKMHYMSLHQSAHYTVSMITVLHKLSHIYITLPWQQVSWQLECWQIPSQVYTVFASSFQLPAPPHLARHQPSDHPSTIWNVHRLVCKHDVNKRSFGPTSRSKLVITYIDSSFLKLSSFLAYYTWLGQTFSLPWHIVARGRSYTSWSKPKAWDSTDHRSRSHVTLYLSALSQKQIIYK